ncbi:hypothetical protein M2164_002958 [Streptomyces sp. SAI-208]|uniref:hypothetical protein n=1 Tax=Streptomyces sp. SAI-208 TaxID=2940550 RepID=UPI0024740DA2|nr:hypothetical protein [Streptomyces sp. SAI-208]MDH6607323.1 hypothetical protein [Streptomyces sp. SAI-208]
MSQSLLSSLETALSDGRAALSGSVNKVTKAVPHLLEATDIVGRSFSGSWIGYHSRFYFGEFEKYPWDQSFDSEWGRLHGIPEGWKERQPEEVQEAILRLSKQKISWTLLQETTERVTERYREIKELVELLESESVSRQASVLAERIKKIKFHGSGNAFLRDRAPNSVMTRDSFALNQGLMTPAHIAYRAQALNAQQAAAAWSDLVRWVELFIKEISSTGAQASPSRVIETLPSSSYVSGKIVNDLKSIASSSKLNCEKLLNLISELNAAYSGGNAYSAHAMIRAIIDHIPPVFGFTKFSEVHNNWTWGRTDKNYMSKLSDFRATADDVLHRQISNNADLIEMEDLPPRTWLNRLLQECVQQLNP